MSEQVTGESTTTPRVNRLEPVLEVRNLRIHYDSPKGDVIAVSDISFDLFEGETLGLVGESGCGKSTTAYGILQLVQAPGRIVGGSVVLGDKDLMTLGDADFRRLRWTELALIPQGAMNSLNPTMRIHAQIADAIVAHEGRQSKAKLKARILELFRTVGLPARIYGMYPHELSGGMKQRVCIAMGIALNPTVVIADEVDERARCGGAARRRPNAAQGQTAIGRFDDHDRSRHGPDGADGRPHRRDVRR